MTLHASERPQRSEVIMPSPYNLAAVLVIGLFALSLAVAGVLFEVGRRWRR